MSDRPIEVHFVDASTGQVFARSEIPLDSLPASFEIATTLQIRDEEWEVVGARPETADEFARTGELVLTLSRIQQVDPKEILFTLPSLADELPEVDADARHPASPLRLHEDDWRQVELVSEALADVVRDELVLIERVHREHGVELPSPSDEAGSILVFRELHVRRKLPEPLPPDLTLDDVVARLPASARELGGVAIEPGEGLVRGGFAYELDGATLYGVQSAGELRVLALRTEAPGGRQAFADTARVLAELMTRHGLRLVDWCRVVSLGPDTDTLLNHFTGR